MDAGHLWINRPVIPLRCVAPGDEPDDKPTDPAACGLSPGSGSARKARRIPIRDVCEKLPVRVVRPGKAPGGQGGASSGRPEPPSPAAGEHG